jgi:putative polyhydroxyalkanoate system protein
MPNIHFQTAHHLSKENAKTKLQTVADQLKNRLGATCTWQGDTLTFDRPGAKGSIDVSDKDVTVDVDLGMMLTPFKGEVEKQLKGYLNQHLN